MRGYDLLFDDFEAGDAFTTAGETVTESQIIGFALVRDPQPFHTDAAHARTASAANASTCSCAAAFEPAVGRYFLFLTFW